MKCTFLHAYVKYTFVPWNVLYVKCTILFCWPGITSINNFVCISMYIAIHVLPCSAHFTYSSPLLYYANKKYVHIGSYCFNITINTPVISTHLFQSNLCVQKQQENVGKRKMLSFPFVTKIIWFAAKQFDLHSIISLF